MNSSTLIRDFVNFIKMKDWAYRPHAFTLNGHLQAFIYLMIEMFLVKIRKPLRYERELIKLSDGGTIALDWHIDQSGGKPSIIKDSSAPGPKKPILACISGLSGGNDNLYLFSKITAASQAGFKCVVINFRGASGVNLTSGMIYWLNSWRDIKEPIDYIFDNYCNSISMIRYDKR